MSSVIFRTILSGLLVLLPLSGCIAPRIIVDVQASPTEDFSALQSYAWLDAGSHGFGGGGETNRKIDRRVRESVDRIFAERGFSKLLDEGQPDFFVSYHLAFQSKLKTQKMNEYYTDYSYDRNLPGHQQTVEYEEGTLVIDIADAREQQLVWRGAAVGEVKEGLSAKELTKAVDKIVRKILSRYPPK